MALTTQEVERVALLARLKLAPEEIEKMRAQLSNILEYIDMLSEVDVTDVPPTAQVTDMVNVFRADESRPSLNREDVVANASAKRDGMFVVKTVFGDE